ncbi:MAG: type II toxin-antitoxin system RelE/ParE family toxin [Acidobacteria bacterium]|nr:type II toxin-antitoxin system RelE/ParE family toxin [Acidobacteriota bacterium]
MRSSKRRLMADSSSMRRNEPSHQEDSRTVMEVRWTSEAAADLEEISDYLDVHLRGRQLFRGALLDSLISSPIEDVGREELVMTQIAYIVAYRVRGEVIAVLYIHHPSRQWPESKSDSQRVRRIRDPT